MAESTIEGIAAPQCWVKIFNTDKGLQHLTEDAHAGRIHLGDFDIIICLMGRADIVCGSHFPEVVDKWLSAVRTYARRSRMIMSGPIPACHDGVRRLCSLRNAARFLEFRLKYEPNVAFCRLSERLYSFDSVDALLLTEDGLTEKGADILRLDLLDAVKSFA